MNNNYFKSGEAGLKLYLAETPSPALGRRRSASKGSPTNAFGMELRDHFAKSAMSQQEFAEVLSIELGRPVSQVNISNWLHGIEPRSRADEPNFMAAVLAAAERIGKRESKAGRQKYADPQKVQAQFAKWDKAGLTAKQIQLAAEISVSLYLAWRNNKVKIPSVRWELAKTKVDMWRDFVVEHQKNWQAQATQAAVKATRNPTKGTKARGR
jgi:hypothetical protein